MRLWSVLVIPRSFLIVKIVDLSRDLYHKTPPYPGHPPIIHGVWTTHEESFAASGNVHGLSSMYISMPDHAGTHIDAFRHFNKGGQPIRRQPWQNAAIPCRRAARCYCAPATTSAPFRARNMRPTIPASTSRPR